MKPSPQDLQFGRLAVQLGYLTYARLEAALTILEQTQPATRLGSILVHKGYLTVPQVQRILEEAKARFGEAPDAGVGPGTQGPGREFLFGKTVIEERLATEAQVQEALRLQEALAAEGKAVRLGEILVLKGYMTPETVQKALARQHKSIMRCAVCGARFNVWVLPGRAPTRAPSPFAAPGDRPAGVKAGEAAGLAATPPAPAPAARRSSFPTPRVTRMPACPDCGGTLAPARDDGVVSVEETVEVAVEPDPGGGAGVAIARVRPSREARATNILHTWPCFEAIDGNPEQMGFGKYKVLGDVEEGGMSIVCRVQDTMTGHTLALKILGNGTAASAEDQARFQEEARILARLRHPNIIAIEAVGVWAGFPYFTMDFVAGTRLDRFLRAKRFLTGRLAAALLRDVADAVAYCHGLGIVHGDLKPGNILVKREGDRPTGGVEERIASAPRLRAILLDFGVAAAVGQAQPGLAEHGEIIGTPAYMAPEQAAGEEGGVGPLSDVYSLGAVLYEMLTGTPPFTADTPAEVLALVINSEPLAPTALNPAADPRAEAICLRAMAHEPHVRYPSVEELRDALDSYLRRQ